MLRFAANLGFFWPELPLVDRVTKAANAGFRAVELHWPYEVDPLHLRDACRSHDVLILGLNSEPGDTTCRDFGLAALPGRETDFRATLTRAIAYATTAGASAIHVLAGPASEARRAEARQTFVKNLRWAADAASAHGLMLLLEPMNRWDRPGYFYSKVAEATTLMADIDRTNVRLMFDAYHVGRTEGDVLAKLTEAAPFIGHVQIAGVPHRAEPDHGDVDYREVFKALIDLGYAGWIGCEYRPRTTVEEGLGWMAALSPGSASGNGGRLS
jgi:hydroxypyruvate isomerase